MKVFKYNAVNMFLYIQNKKSNFLKVAFFGSIIFGVGDSHTSFIWNKK